MPGALPVVENALLRVLQPLAQRGYSCYVIFDQADTGSFVLAGQSNLGGLSAARSGNSLDYYPYRPLKVSYPVSYLFWSYMFNFGAFFRGLSCEGEGGNTG